MKSWQGNDGGMGWNKQLKDEYLSRCPRIRSATHALHPSPATCPSNPNPVILPSSQSISLVQCQCQCHARSMITNITHLPLLCWRLINIGKHFYSFNNSTRSSNHPFSQPHLLNRSSTSVSQIPSPLSGTLTTPHIVCRTRHSPS